jgi:threonine dehydrogenase-like Zn-dependent dehydrogenase
MKAAVLAAPRHLQVREVPEPQAGPGEVIVAVRACGICGSDLRYFAGENPWAKHTLGYEKPNPPDMILGHEIAGVVTGPSGEKAVALLSFKGCGTCEECRRGRVNLCARTAHLGHGAGWEGREVNPGGMAERCPIWAEHAIPIPGHVSFEEATFLDGLGVAVHATRRANLFPGDAFAVLGAGPIGLSIMQTAQAFGAGPAFVTDVYRAALDCATELGAGAAFDAQKVDAGDIAQAIRERTAGRGVAAVFESTGTQAGQELGLSVLAPGGVMVLMAGATPGFRLPEGSLAGERTLTTCSNNLYEDYFVGLQLLASGKVRVKPMITHRFGLDDVEEAFATATDKHESGAIKVIIECGG